MPTYDLQCTSCGLEFERFRQGFLRDVDLVCVGCGAPAQQLMTGFVTSRPPRGRQEPGVRNFGGHRCGGGCGCAAPRTAPDGEIVPP